MATRQDHFAAAFVFATSAAVFACLNAAPAQGQVPPTYDIGTLTQGQVIAGTARGYAERGGWRDGDTKVSNARARQTCVNARAMYRKGDRDAQMRKLLALCKQGGY